MRGFLRAEDVALRTIGRLVKAVDADRFSSVAEQIATDPVSLSCAAELVTRSFLAERDSYSELKISADVKLTILKKFSQNVREAATTGHLFDTNHSGFILWTMARAVPDDCPQLFSALKREDPTLDRFALAYLGSSWDSYGVAFRMPRDESLHNVYCPLSEFKAHATKRLQDTSIQYPEKAAWRSVIEGKSLYGFNGSDANR